MAQWAFSEGSRVEVPQHQFLVFEALARSQALVHLITVLLLIAVVVYSLPLDYLVECSSVTWAGGLPGSQTVHARLRVRSG